MDDLAWLTARDLAGRSAVAAHLERIERVDPRVHAYVHVDRAARAAGEGALAGATVAVKDTQPVAGMPWTYGSPVWRDRIAEADALVVTRARAAGAAILGKTNTPELAASIGTSNAIFPPTENPWRPGWTPGGSSGGSGAAVAAGLCTVAFGDDMGGSIRIPASCCGVVGLRPSPGRVPTEQPEPARLSVRGPLTRSVADARLLLSVMSGRPAPPPARPSGLRVALVVDSPLGVHEACAAAARRAAEALRGLGHTLHPASWDPLPVADSYRVVRPVTVAGNPGSVEDYGEAVRGLIAKGRAISGGEFYQALRDGMAAAAAVNALLEEFDLLLTPTLGDLPMPIPDVPTFLASGWDRYTQFTLPVSYAGLPAVSLPAGQADGLPVGVQLVGREREDWALLDAAEALEACPGFGFEIPAPLR